MENKDPNKAAGKRTLFSALVLFNVRSVCDPERALTYAIALQFVITDGVVVWRASVICRENKLALLICTVLLIFTGGKCFLRVEYFLDLLIHNAATAILVIVARIATMTSLDRPSLRQLINPTQMVNLGLSHLTPKSRGA